MSDPLYDHILEFDDYQSDLNESCDVLVVGSGPTGAVAAYNLADKGLDVMMIEAGPVRRPADFTTDGAKTLAEVCYEGGLRVMRGRSIMPTMQARILGGGSHINSAICVRTPQFCFDDWRTNYSVESINREVLDPHYDRVEEFLQVQATPPEAWGRKNELFKLACDNLGLSSEPMPRNVVGCCGCAECFTGCPTRAKQSMEVSYIPAAIKKGLRVYTSVQMTAIEHHNGQATGIRGVVVHPRTRRESHRVTIRAKRIVMATGCIATPVLLQKSKAPDPHKLIGKDLQAHPGCAFMGIFPEPVNPWHGATQGYQSLAYLEQGFKLEVLWAPPAVLAVRFPDFGHRLKSFFAQMKYGAFWDAFFALKHSKGSVSALPGKTLNPNVKYSIDDRDLPQIKLGLKVLGELFVAAGAEKIVPGVYGLPDICAASEIGDLVERHTLKATDIVLASTHLFSSTRMGPDPTNSVVDERGEMHHLKNCFIVDTGIMPRSPAVNPMLTAMALSDRISLAIAEL